MKHTSPRCNSRAWAFSGILILTMLLSMANAAHAEARTPVATPTALGQAITPANQAPQTPALVAPADGATNLSVPAELSVTVTDPDNDPMDVTFYGRPRQAAGGADFSMVAIPDPQYYADLYPSIFTAQMQWVVDNQAANNIAYVAGLGDSVETASSVSQWQVADSAYSLIEAAGIPFGLAVGNHDIALLNGTTNFNNYFGISRFTGQPYYGGPYGSNNDNHYDLVTAGGMDFINHLHQI